MRDQTVDLYFLLICCKFTTILIFINDGVTLTYLRPVLLQALVVVVTL